MIYRNIIFNLLIFTLLCAQSVYSQRLLKISVSIDDKTEHLSFINRKGISYVSSQEISSILGGTYYYNPKASKVEMKFEIYNLKVTAQNQFFILVSKRKNSRKIFQIPISTLLVKDDVFIPFEYSIPFIELAYGRKLLYSNKEKHLTIGKRIENIAEIITKEQIKSPSRNEETVKIKSNKKNKFDIYDISVEEKTNGTLIRLKGSRQINKFSSSIQENKLFVFISGASVDPNILRDFKPVGFIKNGRLKNVKNNKQIEFALKEGYSMHESSKDIGSDDILITIHNKVFSDFQANLEEELSEWNFDVIVIDAGHGGRDPGAVSRNGIKEKDVNLAITLRLGELIKQNLTGVEVVYTRKTDKFVELYKRGKIANESKGKMFISIHCNSLGKGRSSSRGFEVYLLRPGKTQKAIEIAEIENGVIVYEDNPDRYQELTDENFILVTMAHSQYMRYSEKFSDLLNKKWVDNIKRVPSRGIKQAGFYVLVGASMPGVLIESGFLSNQKDESYLNSLKGQNQIAETIFNAVKAYKEFYDQQFDQES
ncbi:N-acetylmuramoyl-L-alanine amidase [Bacteroidota bacterium]